jgi:hypothetical protein
MKYYVDANMFLNKVIYYLPVCLAIIIMEP